MPLVFRLDVMLAERKMKLKKLSELLGVDYSRLSEIKCGHAISIKCEMLDKICDVLNCQPGDLVKHVTKNDTKFIKAK